MKEMQDCQASKQNVVFTTPTQLRRIKIGRCSSHNSLYAFFLFPFYHLSSRPQHVCDVMCFGTEKYHQKRMELWWFSVGETNRFRSISSWTEKHVSLWMGDEKFQERLGMIWKLCESQTKTFFFKNQSRHLLKNFSI